ncbi:MAG: imidazole glycerol phosphate synthase subunit HisF [Kiritimatiellae bacterium]|nr:imidazole glycerol phosphate synthase subunit HisF [Kiritimatiellia bacterium]
MDRQLVIMPCLDMIAGRVVKGVRFVDIKDAGDPVDCCRAYCAAGADELAMLDITATLESRKTLLEVTRKVADVVTVPFTMGGGISSVQSAEEVLKAGANKISTSSAVFRKPQLVAEMVKEFGPKTVTVAIDVLQNPAMPSGYEVYIDGGHTATGKDAVEWAKEVDGYGVGCILPTSKSTDGVRTGYDLPLIEKIRAVARDEVDVVASGGAGTMEHFAEAANAGANVLLAASVFHFHMIDIPALKEFLKGRGFKVR